MGGMHRPCRHFGLLSLILLLLLPGCRGERSSPEEQVRAQIHKAVTAAEQKDIGELRDMLSEQYTDEQGQNKRAIEALLRLHFVRNQNIYLFAVIDSVNLTSPDRAHAIVLLAMAGVPIQSAQELPALHADLHRFEIDFTHENKTWRVRRAAWRRAEPGEFLIP